jgi:predicted transposase/invertase (TIGR01784 family)
VRHAIDPTVDCVFKALLGAEENRDLLVHFLNSVLRWPVPVERVEILNPYNDREFETDKLTVVDVKARDATGALFQVEVQLAVPARLRTRILYTWADLYQSQLGKGDDFTALRPVVSIWLLSETLLREAPSFHHHFQLCDPQRGVSFNDHLAIHVLELPKWRPPATGLDDEDRWMYFFREAKGWDRLPEALDSPPMRKAMAVLKGFSERERDWHRYQARQNFLRAERTREVVTQQALAERDQLLESVARLEDDMRRAEDDKRRAEDDKRRAQDDVKRLTALLRAAGIEPGEAE